MKRVTLQRMQYALLMYDADDRQVNGTSSCGDLEAARMLAKSTLFLLPGIAYIHIHACDAAGVVAPQQVERVDWDQE